MPPFLRGLFLDTFVLNCNADSHKIQLMATQIITNIKLLAGTGAYILPVRGKQLAHLKSIDNAYVLIEDGWITGLGKMDDLSAIERKIPDQYDASGQTILPCWCDSHTHLVFAGSREGEWIDKLKGLSYAEIAAGGGGILNSALLLNETSEEVLFKQAWERLQELARLGTGALEIKSGYGLSVEGELKMLRVIKRLKQHSNLLIKSTFLGAHAYPHIYKDNHTAYINSIVNEMLPVIAAEKLADYIDVFCETGFFSPEEMETVCKAAMQYGLTPKLHVNQLNSIGGLQKAIELDALTVDHLETMTERDVQVLAESATIGTLLPTAAFFLRMPYQPARQLIEANCAIALASDYNPGSSPSGNMNFVTALSCIQMKLLPEEAINAATINGAFAMELQLAVGSIAIGKKANMIFTKPIPSLAYLFYSFGTNLIDKVMIAGSWV
jgi:imidazolonepropionase